MDKQGLLDRLGERIDAGLVERSGPLVIYPTKNGGYHMLPVGKGVHLNFHALTRMLGIPFDEKAGHRVRAAIAKAAEYQTRRAGTSDTAGKKSELFLKWSKYVATPRGKLDYELFKDFKKDVRIQAWAKKTGVRIPETYGAFATEVSRGRSEHRKMLIEGDGD